MKDLDFERTTPRPPRGGPCARAGARRKFAVELAAVAHATVAPPRPPDALATGQLATGRCRVLKQRVHDAPARRRRARARRLCRRRRLHAARRRQLAQVRRRDGGRVALPGRDRRGRPLHGRLRRGGAALPERALLPAFDAVAAAAAAAPGPRARVAAGRVVRPLPGERRRAGRGDVGRGPRPPPRHQAHRQPVRPRRPRLVGECAAAAATRHRARRHHTARAPPPSPAAAVAAPQFRRRRAAW